MRAVVFTGKIVMVFDPRLWEENGGDSKTDSFFREATILKIYEENLSPSRLTWQHPQVLADIKFCHDGRISKGHFTDGMEECPLAVLKTEF